MVKTLVNLQLSKVNDSYKTPNLSCIQQIQKNESHHWEVNECSCREAASVEGVGENVLFEYQCCINFILICIHKGRCL